MYVAQLQLTGGIACDRELLSQVVLVAPHCHRGGVAVARAVQEGTLREAKATTASRLHALHVVAQLLDG